MEKMARPFRLGTTSFIYPDQIIPNVKKIGGVFDEIELLVFESLPFKNPASGGLAEEVIPSAGDVAELKRLGRELDLTYNVHMPVDVSLTASSARDRQKAADMLNRVLECFAPLNPTSHTLHLDMDKGSASPDGIRADDIRNWEARARDGLDLLSAPHPESICIETLWYDPKQFETIVKDYGLSVCADLGHHFKYGYDPALTFERFPGRIPLIHLHGVDTGLTPPKDHIGLDRMPDRLFGRVANLLASYTGTVSLEVFGLAPLTGSLQRLAALFDGIPAL